MEEIWKDIPEYEGYYQASNLGNIKSLFGKERTLKPGVDKDGYFRYILCKNGKRKSHFGHRLIACTFLPITNSNLQVNHIDGNKQNNCIENLEWCTCRDNIIHSIEVLKHRVKKVDKYDLNNKYIETYQSIEIAGKENNIKSQNIWRCCKNIRPTAGGYIWKYSS